MDHAKILEDLEKVIEELAAASRTAPVIVEGRWDKMALVSLGVGGIIFVLNDGYSILDTCTRLAADYRHVIIMTDWDRRGGRLARQLMDALDANGIRYNTDLRAKLAMLAKREVKDVEGLPKYLARLRQKSGTQ